MYLLWSIALVLLLGGFFVLGRSGYVLVHGKGHRRWDAILGIYVGLVFTVIGVGLSLEILFGF